MSRPFYLIVPKNEKSAKDPFTFGVPEATSVIELQTDPIPIPGNTTTFTLQGPGVDEETSPPGDLSSPDPTFDFTNDPALEADPKRYELNVKLAKPVEEETRIDGSILFTGDVHVPPVVILTPTLKVKRLYAPQNQAVVAFTPSAGGVAVGLFSEKQSDAEQVRNLMIGQASAGGAALSIKQVPGPSKRIILELSAAGDADIDVKPVEPIARAGSHYTPVLHACGPFQLGRFCDSYDLACADRGAWAYISSPAIQAIEALPACIVTGLPVTRVDHD